MAPSTAKTLTFLLLLFPLLTLSYPPPTPGLDTFISSFLRRDPRGANDTFLSLPPSLKRSLAVAQPPSLLLHALTVAVPVHVRLVGSFPPDAPALLSAFVSSAHTSSPYHVIARNPNPNPNPNNLAISHSLHLDAELSSPALGSRIHAAVKSRIAGSTAPLHHSALFPVPFAVVDEIVREDFRREEANSAGFFVYLLNLRQQDRSYAYSYSHDGDSSAAPSFSRCMGSLWTGRERYLWIDLAAGPVDYGPALSGEGLLLKSEFHPLGAAIHGRVRSERTLLADLASLVFSAYQSLLVPSLRVPVFYDDSLVVRFVHVYGSDPVESHGLNWNNVERVIRDAGLLMRDQVLRFETVGVKISECPICSFALARSTNSFTSRFLFDNYTLIVSDYLDSKRLHQILSDSADEIYKLLDNRVEEYGRVVPVYVFDLDYDRLLMLDRYHQSVAFRNMVIAVRTRTSQTVSDYSCNGRHVITQTRELERPIIGSLLQTVWGVTPTHLRWSPQHNSTLMDYTWSVGQTPFGPFTESTSLSFVQKDAARRNMLLTTLNSTITGAVEVLNSMAALGGDRKLLKNSKHVEFVQRWNLLKYKIDKTVTAISHLDYEKALYFLRSSDHDLYAIHNLVYLASRELEASLVCFRDPPFPWSTVLVSFVILLALFYAYFRRDQLFTNKRKQF